MEVNTVHFYDPVSGFILGEDVGDALGPGRADGG